MIFALEDDRRVNWYWEWSQPTFGKSPIRERIAANISVSLALRVVDDILKTGGLLYVLKWTMTLKAWVDLSIRILCEEKSVTCGDGKRTATRMM